MPYEHTDRTKRLFCIGSVGSAGDKQRVACISTGMNAAMSLIPVALAPFPRLRRTVALVEELVCAGFPSPSADYRQRPIDLNEELIAKPLATFLIRVSGRSGEGDFVRDGDIIVVDRSLKPRDGDEVIVVVENDTCVKRFRQSGARKWLESATEGYPVIELGPESEVRCEGVVTWSLHKIRR